MKGIIEFNPEDKTNKHRSQSEWKRVAMIRTYCDLDRYYAWFLKKRFNLELNRNLRGTHVSFINDRLDIDIFNEASKLFDGKEIEFFVENLPLSNGKHWWLRVYCPEAESIREVMGLERDPHFGMHLTIGYAIEKYPEDNTEITLYELKYKLKGAKYRKDLVEVANLLEQIKVLQDNELPIIKAKKDYLEHSKYIFNNCLNKEVYKRIPLSEQKIIEFKN